MGNQWPTSHIHPVKHFYQAHNIIIQLVTVTVNTVNVISLMKSSPLIKLIVSYDHNFIKVNIFPISYQMFWIKAQKMSYRAQFHKIVAHLYDKNVECGLQVKKVAHPCNKPSQSQGSTFEPLKKNTLSKIYWNISFLSFF